MMGYENETDEHMESSEYGTEERLTKTEKRLAECESKISKMMEKMGMRDDEYEEDEYMEDKGPMGREETTKKIAVIMAGPGDGKKAA